MYLHFDEIKTDLPKEIFENKTKIIYDWSCCQNENSYLKFNQINLFVGANNSGKSRFLRGLLKIPNKPDFISNNETCISKKIIEYNRYSRNTLGKLSINFRARVNSHLQLIPFNNINIQELLANFSKYQTCIDFFDKEFIRLDKLKFLNRINAQQLDELDFCFRFRCIIEDLRFIKINRPSSKRYIPILRSVHVNKYLQTGNFKETIKINYDINKNVFTGLELFNKVLDLKTSPTQERKKIKEFEMFLSRHFFENKEVEITSNTKEGELLFSIDEVEYPIHNLGDGIQSIIVLLFPIFTAGENEWFFIEEPEINLHPGLQRIFIQTLLYDDYLKRKNLRYFFTTHSNHFLDTTLLSQQVSIFQFEKNEEEKFKIKTDIKPSKDVLDILGVNTSSVFLSNTSIWVEGPTDRKYISKLLSLIFEKKNQWLKEDIDYSFFEYGGNLIEHYLFGNDIEFDEETVRDKINSFALSNKIYLLADNDNVDMRSAKGKRRKLLEENAKKNQNFYYQNTELKEIENLLPKDIIKGFLIHLVKDIKNKKILEEIEFDKSNYDKVGLGKFYEVLLLNNNIPKKNHRAFKADSGTLKNDYKIKLANFVINSHYKYEDFIKDNDTLKIIIENLFKFIKK
ncbi:ATP-binding protein [Winogradskyella sp.]|uniref:AAA family ATPase n=1 Tax=Winogradskyella sp. TaxID=1883156 RepID=UPI0026370592|nr:ATP-binding protein [Winogradskyella sp.]